MSGEGTTTGGATAVTSSGEDTLVTSESSSDGPTSGGPTSDGPTSDGPTSDGPTSGGLEELFLPGCGFESPCPPFYGYCDYDGCAGKEASPDKDCIFQALSASWNGTPVYVEVTSAAEGAPMAIYAHGDGTAVVELTSSFSECELQPAAWFDACVGNVTDDTCYDPLWWRISGSCTMVDPSCPGD